MDKLKALPNARGCLVAGLLFILMPLDLSAQQSEMLPQEVRNIIDAAGQYPASMPLPVIESLVKFRVAELSAEQRRGLSIHAPLGATHELQRAARPLESAFRLTKRSLLPLYERTAPTFQNPNPVTSLRVSAFGKVVSPPYEKMNRAANHVLDVGMVRMLPERITPAQFSAFAAIPSVAVFDTSDAAVTYLASVEQYLDPQWLQSSEFGALGPVAQAELVKMLQIRATTRLEGGQSAQQVLSELSRLAASDSVRRQSVAELTAHLDRIRQTVHRLVDQEERISETFRATQQEFGHDIERFTSQLQAAGSALNERARMLTSHELSGGAVATVAQIGPYVEKYSRAVNEIRIGANVLNELAAGKLPTTDLLAKVTGLGGSLPPEVAGLAGSLQDLLQHQQDLASGVSSLLNGSNDIVSGLETSLGGLVDGVLSDSGADIAGIATSILGGNFLALAPAIPGLGSLLGGLGLGGGSQQVLAKLAAMDRKLDQILAGQRQILEAINTVNQNVLRLTDIVVQNHAATMARLDEIQKDILVNRELAISILAADLNACYLLGDGPRQHAPDTGSVWTSFRTYEAFQGFLATNLHAFQTCQLFLRSNLLSLRTGVHSLLKIGVNDRGGRLGDVQAYLRDYVRPHYAKFNELYSNLDDRTAAIEALTMPSTTIVELFAKAMHAQGETPPSARTVLTNVDILPTGTDMSAVLHADVLADVGWVAQSVLPMWFLIRSNAGGTLTVLDRTEAHNPSTFDRTQMDIVRANIGGALDDLLRLLNSAIAQQAALSGDVLLPKLAAQFPMAGAADPWLVSDTLLRRNLMLWLAAERNRANGRSLLSYAIALEATVPCPAELSTSKCVEPGMLAAALNLESGALLKRRNMLVGGAIVAEPACGGEAVPDGQWYLELAANICQRLPSVAELQSGQILLTSECLALIRVRENLLDLLASMQFRTHPLAAGPTVFSALLARAAASY